MTRETDGERGSRVRKSTRRTPRERQEWYTTFVLTTVAVALSALLAAMLVARYL